MKSIPDFFTSNGELAGIIQDYQHRPEQSEMADAILSTIENGEDLICEAGTGTGKTIAYLLPALLSEKKTVVSTGTRHLQDQLKQKDLPVVLDALNHALTTCVLKGRSNYLCLERMHHALDDPERLNAQQITSIQAVMDWATHTDKGDINELNVIENKPELRPMITSTTENCFGQSCHYYEDCYVFKNRKAAMEADLVITNHHLLLADMGLRESGFGEVLPIADTIIFDEAHQLPELASTYFSKVLSSRQLLELITDIRTADKKEAADIKELEPQLIKFEKILRDVRLLFGRRDRRIAWQALANDTEVNNEIQNLLNVLQDVIDILEMMHERGKLLEQCWSRIKHQYDYIEQYTQSNNQILIR
ncbi:MAG: ATP-dependent DNA helicase, partial [Pseudomonadota bacterium]